MKEIEELKIIDYSITDKQLADIAKGLNELDDDNNAFIIIRGNEVENNKVKSFGAILGNQRLLIQIILHMMDINPSFNDLIIAAAKMQVACKMQDLIKSFEEGFKDIEGNE